MLLLSSLFGLPVTPCYSLASRCVLYTAQFQTFLAMLDESPLLFSFPVFLDAAHYSPLYGIRMRLPRYLSKTMLPRLQMPLQAVLPAELQSTAVIRARNLFAQAPAGTDQVVGNIIMSVIDVALHVPFGSRCVAAGVDRT